MTNTNARAEALFKKLLAVPPDERLAMLAHESGGNEVLAQRVRELLQAMEREDDFLTAGLGQTLAPTTAPIEKNPLPAYIGGYRILRQIGEGGFGTVYVAEQTQPVHRQVAIKALKRGVDTEDVLHRFRLEQNLLAALRHPGIAELYDAGETEDGRPYFVMEYIDGQPLDEYCQSQRLSIDERLRLFQKVCSAVHCAHQNLVVHRDLKPGNILVTSDGQPKVFDFGIAKLLNPHFSPVGAHVTAPDLRIMTPQYASPEQVRGEPITTSSDVYTLGVILYELLTGHPPYAMTKGTPDELQRLVCDVDPDRPSSPTTGFQIKAGSHARSRSRTNESSVRRRLTGDVDNIILMALRKEPHRRYDSAEQFGADIQRHLDGMPVIARPDTYGYRVSKFVSRHRAGVTASALVSLAVLGGLTGTILGMNSAVKARDGERTVRELMEAQTDLVWNFVFDTTEVLKADEGTARLQKDLLTSLESISEEWSHAPIDDATAARHRELNQAKLNDRIGDLWGGTRNPNLGDPDRARQRYEAARTMRADLVDAYPDDRELQLAMSRSWERLGDLAWKSRDLRAAHDAYSKQIAIQRAHLVDDVPSRRQFAHSMSNLGKILLALDETDDAKKKENEREATRLYEQSLKLRREIKDLTPDRKSQRELSVAQLRLAGRRAADGDYEDSLRLNQQALATRESIAQLTPDRQSRRDVSIAHYFVANSLVHLGRYDEAGSQIEECHAVAAARIELAPENLRAAYDYVSALELITVIARATGPDEADAAATKALTASRDALDRWPEDDFLQELYVTISVAASEIMSAQGDDARALDVAVQAVRVAKLLNIEDSSEQLELSIEAHLNAARRAIDHGRAPDEYLREVEERRRARAIPDAMARDILATHLQADCARGDVARLRERLDEARAAATNAPAILSSMARAYAALNDRASEETARMAIAAIDALDEPDATRMRQRLEHELADLLP